MTAHDHVLGIDFGTSNTGAAYLRDDAPQLIEFEDGKTTIPTSFFFEYDSRKTLIGHHANQALLDGADGRFMRALKRVLGTTLMHQPRQILNKRVTFVDIIGDFLRHIKMQAEGQSGLTFDRAVSGRPVVFHKEHDPREAQAEADLKACYIAAGFQNVTFVDEPEAAAIADGALERSGNVGLIVDIGGGTSDFSLFRTTETGTEILANHGVRIGGTDFDRAISIDRVMPLLGKGGLLRDAIGPGTSPCPNAIFNDLATWEKIPFLYTGQTRRMVNEMVRQSVDPDTLGRLGTVLEHELGHDIAFAVERGKIDANAGGDRPLIVLEHIERGLSAQLQTNALAGILAPFGDMLARGAEATLARAGLNAGDVDRVCYVGGSSLMTIVTQTMKSKFPTATHSFSEVFTAVTDGLALSTARS